MFDISALIMTNFLLIKYAVKKTHTSKRQDVNKYPAKTTNNNWTV